MRVSSSAPAMSRRSILRGIAFALVGASVPAAAFVGREIGRPNDGELVGRCQLWKDQGRKLKRMEKRLRVYAAEAKSRAPALPSEFYEQIDYNGYFPVLPSNGAFVNGPYSWSREELTRMASGDHPMEGADEGNGPSSPDCQANCRRLLRRLAKHERAVKQAWREHDRFERRYIREWRDHWRLFMQVIGTRAETLAGAAAQFEVIEREDLLSPFRSHAVAQARVVRLMRNVRRLVAAQSAEA
ncbi:hypothetical protein [Taklimakanibacter albus]|uniref:Uncharacterized protein n=1 Tax=Taklimakanibacter albus TaxID=2800327 RepID=A0ACC5R1B5_9HYPH|nr:hypothetical protein [Aestuariivirga sp. YIM B02566]MBK1866403.1 hypothetical protein [Aestuariivirga sp. YIM B02566]